MKRVLGIVSVALIIVLTGCKDVSGDIAKMVPEDATSVVCVDVFQILEKSGMIDGGKLRLPEELSSIIADNDDSLLSRILSDAQESGIDIKNKIFVYTTLKTFGIAALIPIENEDNLRAMVLRKIGANLEKQDGIEYALFGKTVLALRDGVFFAGRLNGDVEKVKVVKALKSLYSQNKPGMLKDEAVRGYVEDGSALNLFLTRDGIRQLARDKSLIGPEIQDFPLISFLRETDVDALKLKLSLEDGVVKVDGDIVSKKGSDYEKLATGVLSKPNNDFLKAIPSTMKHIVVVSVNGEKIAGLLKIDNLLKEIPSPLRQLINLKDILGNIDGSVAIGVSPDDTFEGDWNGVVAMRVKKPESIMRVVSLVMMLMGQSPQIMNGEYAYEYKNKAISMGVKGDNILYIKALNYEQTEGYADKMEDVSEFFKTRSIGLYSRIGSGSDAAKVCFGMKGYDKIEGELRPAEANVNAALLLIKSLCKIKPAQKFAAADSEDDYIEESAIEGLRPVTE